MSERETMKNRNTQMMRDTPTISFPCYKLFSVFFLLGISLSLIILALTTKPILEGDGHEYALILEGFFNHFSPDIQVQDGERLIQLIHKYPNSNYNINTIKSIIDAIQAEEYQAPLGIFKSNYGQYFGYHFWFYSLVSLPSKFILSILNLNELKAFQLTNAFLMIAVITYTLIFSKQDYITRYILVIFYLIGCNFLYLRWPHPELYTAALLFIGSCAFIDRCYRLATIMVALAALQNPSAVLFIPLIILTALFTKYGFKWINLVNKNTYQYLIQLGLLASVSLSPYGFYYYNFKISNLILKNGFIDYNLIGIKRFLSVLFDLNQGMIVGYPGIFVGVLILWIYRVLSISKTKSYVIFNSSDILLLSTVLMLIPTLGQVNWNPGQEVFSRYAFWAAMPLSTWVGVNLSALKNRSRLSIVILIFLLQLIPHAFFLKRSNYLVMKLHARWVLDNLPGWYKPDPEIFAERTQGFEGFMPSQSPYSYISQKGDITQILLAKGLENQVSKKVCGNTENLVESQTSKPVNLSTVSFDRQGWGYLIGHFRCRLPITISFSNTGNSRIFVHRGWSKPDDFGTSTNNAKAEIIVPLDDQAKKPVKLVAVGNAFVNKNYPNQIVEVIVNDKILDRWLFMYEDKLKERQLIIPVDVFKRERALHIVFKMVESKKILFNRKQLKLFIINLY